MPDEIFTSLNRPHVGIPLGLGSVPNGVRAFELTENYSQV